MNERGPMLLMLGALAMPAWAAQMDIETFNNLRRGMPESEVLLRAGPPDRVTSPDSEVVADGGGGTYLLRGSGVRRLHYLPGADEHDPHLTIVTITRGRVSALDRHKFLAPRPAPAAPARPAPRGEDDILRERAERTLEAAERYAEVRDRIKQRAREAPPNEARPLYRGTDASGNPYYGDVPPPGDRAR